MNTISKHTAIAALLFASHPHVSATEPDESTLIKFGFDISPKPDYNLPTVQGPGDVCGGEVANLYNPPQDVTSTTNWLQTEPCSCAVKDPTSTTSFSFIVDLGARYSITHVKVLDVNAAGGYTEDDSLLGFELVTSDAGASRSWAYCTKSYTTAEATWNTLTCSHDARYLWFSEKTGKGLKLCGMKIYGTPIGTDDWAVVYAAADAKVEEVKSSFDTKDAENKQCLADKQGIQAQNNQCSTDKQGIEAQNNQCQSDKQGIQAQNNQCASDKQGIEAQNNQCQSDKQGIEAQNNQCSTDKQGIEAENNKCKSDKQQCATDKQSIDTENKQCKSDKSEIEAQVVGGDNCSYKLFGRYWFCKTPKEEEE